METIRAEQERLDGSKKESGGDKHVRPERISELSKSLEQEIQKAIKAIQSVNEKTRLLALNALIEASGAGQEGAGFAVVANEMKSLSGETAKVAANMVNETAPVCKELNSISRQLTINARGQRLCDLALTNIDLIDRNLFERTCDVRWWATDKSLVDAAAEQTKDATEHASDRLGVIIGAYTVYTDLLLTDVHGKIIANANKRFSVLGEDASEAKWFKTALKTTTGDEYGFQPVHNSKFLGGESTVAYSCAVREGGQTNGKVIGVLGVLFTWKSLAQTIVEQTPIPPAERETSDVYIIDTDLNILANSRTGDSGGQLNAKFIESCRDSASKYALAEVAGARYCVGFARAPGYEGYSTGWLSVIVQKMPNS